MNSRDDLAVDCFHKEFYEGVPYQRLREMENFLCEQEASEGAINS